MAAGFKPLLKYAIEPLQVGAMLCGFKRVGFFGGVIIADDKEGFMPDLDSNSVNLTDYQFPNDGIEPASFRTAIPKGVASSHPLRRGRIF